MPINIPTGLPAADVLASEQVFVMTQDRAERQDIRPLDLLFLNLMPKKIVTEIQYMRKLSSTPIQINIDLLRIDHHVSHNTPQSHLDTFYKDFSEIKNRYFDGMIITGAPLDQTEFEDVTYWEKLTTILDWTKTHVTSTLFSCWGVAAALKHFYGIPLMNREVKLSGVFEHEVIDRLNPFTRGFDDYFYAPHSRFIDFPAEMFKDKTDLTIIAESRKAGVFLASSQDRRQLYVTGHPEYDPSTLADEFYRDLSSGLNPKLPKNYFPDDDPSNDPICNWRATGALLFRNWVNFIYQETPYDFVMRHD